MGTSRLRSMVESSPKSVEIERKDTVSSGPGQFDPMAEAR